MMAEAHVQAGRVDCRDKAKAVQSVAGSVMGIEMTKQNMPKRAVRSLMVFRRDQIQANWAG